MKITKSLYIFLAILFLSVQVSAQLNRSVQPKPGPAPEIQIGEHKTFTLNNGLQVIVVENHKLPRISYQLTIEVDPVMEKDAVGYISMAGDLMRSGTQNKTKQEIDEAVDFIGADFYTYSNGMYALALTKHKDEILEIMSDVLLHPSFPKDELEKTKTQTISGLAFSKTDASTIASRVGQKLRFPDHPYGEIQTEESIQNITREHLVNYYDTYYKPNTSYLVIVGDITLKDAKKDAEKYFGQWQKGDVPPHTYEMAIQKMGTRVALVHKESAVQSYISINYPVYLKTGSDAVIPANLANNILGSGSFSSRLLANLREDKAYTYGAYSNLVSDPLIGYFNAYAQVGTEFTEDAVNQFLIEINRMNSELISEEDLSTFKNIAIGSFARNLEDPQTVANYALNTIRYEMPKDYYTTYLEKVSRVTTNQVQELSKKYINSENAIILVVGDKEKIVESLKKFSKSGELELYDISGNPVEEVATISTDANVDNILDRYIEAIGGREKIEKVENLKQKMSTLMNGMSFSVFTYIVEGKRFCIDMQMNGNSMTKQVFNGSQAFTRSFQGEQELLGDDFEKLKAQTHIFKELNYKDIGYAMNLVGMEKIDGKDAYKIESTNNFGEKEIVFYDVETALKVQIISTFETPQGVLTQIHQLKDYREVDGVKFPHLVKLSGIQNMEMTVDAIEINSEIPEITFVL